MPNLAAVDWLILMLCFFFAISVGLGLKPFVTGSKAYLQAGRALPAWLCGLAFCAAGLGAQTVLCMGAAGAHYGLASVGFYAVGAVPAMVFAGLVMMPVYYGSQAPTVPGYLRLRFDEKTRTLNACLFLVTGVVSAAGALYAMARVLGALRVFDATLNALHVPPHGELLALLALPAVLVLAYVLLGGLAGVLYNQVLQFCVLTAGLLPLTLLAVKQAGGWAGMKAAAATTEFARGWSSGGHAGLSAMALAAGIGLVLGASTWCTDYRVLQAALAAKDLDAARRAPLIGAAAWLVLAVVLIVPGVVAIGMPTPHTRVVVRNEDGAIYHDITVVPQAAEAGQGLVPAETDSKSDLMEGKPLKDAGGHALLNYGLATPEMMLHFLPTGLLGLGMAALLASLMSGVAASVMGFAAVFTCDLYQPHLGKDASDGRLLAVGRWAAVGAMAVALGTACGAIYGGWTLERLVVLLAGLSTPMLGTFLLGMLWKRTTGHGAFAGMLAGLAAAGLPWRQADGLAGHCWMVLAALGANVVVTAGVSLATAARPEVELTGLVVGQRPRAKSALGRLAVLLLAAAAVVGLILSV